MSACIQRIDNKHRQVAEYPALCADGPAGPAEMLTLTGERLCSHKVATVEEFGFDRTGRDIGLRTFVASSG